MAFELDKYKEVSQVTTIQDTSLGIMSWGISNAFPQTLINFINQSPNASPAVDRTKKFYRGQYFEGEDMIVNSSGQTLGQVVTELALNMAIFKAHSIHTNFNMKSEVTEIIPLDISDLRFNVFDDLNYASKLGYHPDYGYNSEIRKSIRHMVTRDSIKWIDRFNPSVVEEQIERTEGGIANYKGQILYYSETGVSSYPIPPLQPQINYILADIENSILARKEANTGFINNYIFKTMWGESDPRLDMLKQAFEDAQGARGTGSIIALTGLSPEEMSNTVLEEISCGNGTTGMIESIDKMNEICNKAITRAYFIPSVLAGSEQQTGFSAPDLRDAYFIFNAQTKDGRNAIENSINRVLKNSVFPIKEIHLEQLTLDEDIEENTEEKVEDKKIEEDDV